jgi:DNA-binding FadR family transcriptional regulator
LASEPYHTTIEDAHIKVQTLGLSLPMPLQTVAPQRLYRQIAEQLRGLIGKGEFGAGQRLPAERDLARLLGVSRPSVREALIALEVQGWVEVRVGSGVYVTDRNGSVTPSETLAPAEWGPLELIRARRVLEGETAAIAAQKARPKDLEDIRRAITTMRQEASSGVIPQNGDRAFHSAIAQIGGNSVLLETVQHFYDARRGPVFSRLGGHFETTTSWRAAIREHEAIADAIEAKDPVAARAAMHRHMDASHRRFSANWKH